LTTDNVRPLAKPNQWHIGRLTLAGSVMGGCFLAFCTTATLLIGKYTLHLSLGQLQALSVLALVFGGEAILCNARERQHLWNSLPGKWVIAASIADIAILSGLAAGGLVLHPLPPGIIAGVLAAAIAFALLLDLIKVPVLRRLQIAPPPDNSPPPAPRADARDDASGEGRQAATTGAQAPPRRSAT
jgi:H+-transporting ATPase